MTEAEILDLVSVHQELSLMLWQWWLSVSAALLAAGSIFGKKLNLYLLIMLLMAYALYTAYVIDNYMVLLGQFGNLAADLRALNAQGDIGSTATSFIEKNANPGVGVTFGLFVGAAMLFFGTIGFLVYSFRRSRTIQ